MSDTTVKLMLLSDWAKKHGLPLDRVKDAARQGSLRKYVKTALIPTKRYTILENTDPAIFKKNRKAT